MRNLVGSMVITLSSRLFFMCQSALNILASIE